MVRRDGDRGKRVLRVFDPISFDPISSTIASFEGQMLSFILRIGAAFILDVAAWQIFARYARSQALPPPGAWLWERISAGGAAYSP